MAWKQVGGAGGAVSTPNATGFYQGDGQNGSGTSIIFALSFAEVQRVKADVDAGMQELKERRRLRLEVLGDNIDSSDKKRNGLMALTRSGNAANPSPNYSIDQATDDTAWECARQILARVGEYLERAEEAQERILSGVQRVVAQVANKDLWSLISPNMSSDSAAMIALVNPAMLGGAGATDLGPSL